MLYSGVSVIKQQNMAWGTEDMKSTQRGIAEDIQILFYVKREKLQLLSVSPSFLDSFLLLVFEPGCECFQACPLQSAAQESGQQSVFDRLPKPLSLEPKGLQFSTHV